ncbi:M56 family metallopeptidase [Brevibacillus reuszeri]|uniref:M56 family metallopeptidase n=1 Tax=Brevibacillus reuszeri TaxID=54915 RepID=UPI00289C5796|nr:M56 family metallopeptidase [Brevibacillus reuszeri]
MIKWLLMTSLAGSVSTLFLILLKARLAGKYGGRWYYGACLSSLLLFIFPLQFPVPALPSHSMTFEKNIVEDSAKGAVVQKDEMIPGQPANPLAKVNEGYGSLSLGIDQWLLSLWACGFIVTLCRYLLGYFLYKRKVLREHKWIGKVEKLDVVVCGKVSSPMLIGFWKPKIVMPNVKIDRTDYKMAVRHEWIHYRQKDAWFKLLAVCINSVHWFNPFSYMALANVGEACEYAVDEKMTQHMKAVEKKRYSEMILQFAANTSPALNNHLVDHKKLLIRRFRLIMKKNSESDKAFSGILLAVMIGTASVFISSVVFAEAPKPLTEYSGGITTYYNTAQTLEQNVQSTLGIPSPTEKTRVVVKWKDLYIDKEGRKIDYFNRTEPAYKVEIKWQDKGSAVASMTNKTMSIGGQAVTVAFGDKAVAYKNDPVIEKMIGSQIMFEMNYQTTDRRFMYDHKAFMNELVKRGAYVIEEVVAPQQFAYDFRQTKAGGQAGAKPLTAYDMVEGQAPIFKGNVLLPKQLDDNDGSKGLQIGHSFVLKPGETVAIDLKETTDKTPTISLAILDETTGEMTYWYPAAASGYRFIFTPGQNGVNHTYQIIASGEQQDTVKMEVFTYQLKTEMAK